MLLLASVLASYRFGRVRVPSTSLLAIDAQSGAAAGFNVVLFTLDTLRADRVHCYGYEGVATPALDALAADGVRIADAVSVVPMTLPAHATIMTGDYPPRHGVRDNGTYRLTPNRETLATRLKARGYSTAAFIAAFVLDRRYGLDQGFDVYDDAITPEQGAPGGEPLNPQRRGDVVIDSAARWLEAHEEAASDRPFFTWIHLFDPHTPYAPPEPFKTQYARNLYDGEVAFLDRQVGRFVDRLRELDLLDNTVIAIVGDHGEGLGDHGESTHSLLIYESTISVPMIFHSPAIIHGGQVVDGRVAATIDVAPTLLDLLGLDAGGHDGESLLKNSVDPDRAVYVETLAPKLNHGWSPLYALRRHRDKYIDAPTPEYYDLNSDPGELHSLWAGDHRETEVLAERLAALMESFDRVEHADGAGVELDRDAIEKLAALGYVRGRVLEKGESLLDPKDMIAQWDSRMERASALVGAGRHNEAIPLINSLLQVSPGDASLWSLLSMAQVQASQVDAAITSRRRAIELQPNDAGGWVALANMQLVKGHFDAWNVSLLEAERIEPELGTIFIARALRAMYAGRYQDALAHCLEARTRDPTRSTAPSRSLEDKIRKMMRDAGKAEAAGRRVQEGAP
jgi:arylsulfatase A-like enzyme